MLRGGRGDRGHGIRHLQTPGVSPGTHRMTAGRRTWTSAGAFAVLLQGRKLKEASMHSTLARIALALALPTTALAQGLDQGLQALHVTEGLRCLTP